MITKMSGQELTGIFPRTEPSPSWPESELAVYRHLKDALPVGWTAWHSLKVRTKNAEFAEADFVIADPARGVLVLEVKGGLIAKDEGVWRQNGQPMKASPLDQAHRFVRLLLAKFKDRGMTSPPIGVATAFPDTDFELPPSQGDLEGIVIGARDLPYLGEILPRVLERALRPITWGRPSPDWVAFVHGLWCESWPKSMSLSQLVKVFEAKRTRLDAEQFMALESILENDLVLVRGGAGTGKTLLARELAIREAHAGRSFLLLTFTDALGLELAKQVGLPGSVVSPVGRFALDRLRQTGFGEPERYEPAFWDDVTRSAAESADIWDGCGFDTVIVDEGQDFGAAEWKIVERCGSCRGPRRLWIFADEDQAFWDDRRIPAEIEARAVKYVLKRPYRCPPAVQALADAYVDGGWGDGTGRLEAVAQGSADGTIKVVVCGDGEPEAHAAVGREIRAAKKLGFAEREIAVVSLRGMMHPGNVMHNSSLGRCELAQATDLAHRERVICDTFLRYKGLERPMVIVGDVSPDSSRYPVRMNIAVSRAFGALRVVASRGELRKDPVLKRMAEMDVSKSEP
jgi:hypothetical protein